MDNLEEVLVSSDVGVNTTLKIIQRIEKRVAADKYLGTEELNKILREEIAGLLSETNTGEATEFDIPANKKPYVIMVVGVNGVGKTTIIDNYKKIIEEKYRKEVILLRHRPRILPILSALKHGNKDLAEKIAGQTIPRQGKNTSSISSYLRFSYYYMDYIIGQMSVYFKYTIRGKIVLYDRYYFDFIHDAKRSNIHINKNISKFLYRFIHKPRVNYFLYANPEVILKRKKELEANTITALTNDYHSLFSDLNQKYKASKYVSIENNDLEHSLKIIDDEFCSAA